MLVVCAEKGGEVKVLHLLRKYDPCEWGGTESAVSQLLAGLRTHGASSVVYAPRVSGRAEPRDDLLARGGYPVRRFRAFVPAMGLSRDDRARLVAVGGNLMSFDLPFALLRERSVSVIHSHALGRLGGIARMVAARRRVPFVVTIHGGYRDLPEDVRRELTAPLSRAFEYGKAFGLLVGARRVIHGADAVLTCNLREASLLRAEMPPARVVHMPHGIPTELYREDHRAKSRELLGEFASRRILLSVARIDAVKNQGFLVDHLPAIVARHKDAVLVLVGPTTDHGHHRYVERRIGELGLGAHVRLLGPLPPQDPRLIGLSQLASISVLASRSETFGLAILEAWAAGSPVVASRTSGAEGLIHDGEDGYLFTVDDGEGYVKAVSRMLENPDRARAMAERGAGKVADRYDQNAIAKRVLDLYENLSVRR